MKSRRIVLISFLSLFSFAVHCQTGEAVFEVYKEKSGTIHINGQRYSTGNKILQTAGEQIVTFWAPTKKKHDRNVFFYPDSIIYMTIDLLPTDNYATYLKAMMKFRNKRNVVIILPLFGIASLVGITVPIFFTADDYHTKAAANLKNYQAAYNWESIEVYKTDFQINKEAYQSAMGWGIAMASITGIATGLYGYLVWKYKKNRTPRPEYQVEEFSRLNLGVQPNWIGGMNYNVGWRF